jgi:hypothetical protein
MSRALGALRGSSNRVPSAADARMRLGKIRIFGQMERALPPCGAVCLIVRMNSIGEVLLNFRVRRRISISRGSRCRAVQLLRNRASDLGRILVKIEGVGLEIGTNWNKIIELFGIVGGISGNKLEEAWSDSTTEMSRERPRDRRATYQMWFKSCFGARESWLCLYRSRDGHPWSPRRTI